MKRDMELIRKVMLEAEKSKDPFELIDPKFEGHNETEISYHIALLADAGLLHGQDRSAIGIFRWSAGTLTWAPRMPRVLAKAPGRASPDSSANRTKTVFPSRMY